MQNSVKKILIVEDNDLNLKLFRDLLKAEGYRVFENNDGHHVMQMVHSVMPDLILMDIQLHGVSGYDLIRHIKSNHLLYHIPVIAITAFAMKDDKEKIMASGCEAYIAKPIAIRSFLKVIRGFLQGEETTQQDSPEHPVEDQ